MLTHPFTHLLQVDLQNINYEEFVKFLNELFSNGISRERIVVLLFFCSDIVVRAYNNPLSNFKKLYNWFLQYIIDKVCTWVQDHGGWVGNKVTVFLIADTYLKL